MSTLKTNNIEHLDASTPSIQTTIGGGTILAGVSTVSGALNVGTGTSISSPATNELALGTNDVERLRITSDGYARLTTANARLEWTASSGSNPFIRSIGSGQQELEFNTGGTERLRITSAGKVLVGTETNVDDYLFQVDSSAFRTAQFTRYTSDGATVVIGSSRGTQSSRTPLNINDYGGLIEFKAYEGSDFSSLGRISGQCEAAAAVGDTPGRLVFWTTADDASSPTERMRITSGGEVQIANGNLKFSTSGTGIDFSATSDGPGAVSEILQDYEEGEWTPEVVGSTGGTAAASTGAGSGGWYVRVGNTVWLSFYFANPTITGTMSGSLRLNLPFTNANNDRFDNGGGGNVTYTRNLKSGDDHRRITFNADQGVSYARFKTLYDNSTSETADLTQTMAGLANSTLIKGNIIMRVDG